MSFTWIPGPQDLTWITDRDRMGHLSIDFRHFLRTAKFGKGPFITPAGIGGRIFHHGYLSNLLNGMILQVEIPRMAYEIIPNIAG